MPYVFVGCEETINAQINDCQSKEVPGEINCTIIRKPGQQRDVSPDVM